MNSTEGRLSLASFSCIIDGMITFDQTLDAVERIYDQLKSVAELENQIEHARANMMDFATMLEYAHQRDFQTSEEALGYIDKVLLPRLHGIITALESGTDSQIKRLKVATEHTQRLLANLQLVTGNDTGGLAR